MSVLLALDSSTEHMALALVGQGHAAFVDADGGALASQRLVPDVMALLNQAGLPLAAVDAVGFGRGPRARWRRDWRSAPASPCWPWTA